MRKPRAFLSYSRQADRHDQQAVSTLREALEGELHLLTGEPFEIFQDWQDIGWGESWRHRIAEALEESLFVIPIVTEGLFKSEVCREELKLFAGREKTLSRNDLILPLLYARCPSLERRSDDPLVRLISARNWLDWRELRHESVTGTTYRRAVAQLAERLIDAIERAEDVEPHPGVLVVPSQQQPNKGTIEQSGTPSLGKTAARSIRSVPLVTAKEPRTLVVDAMGRGDHTKLTDAVARALPGTRLLVHPGLYRGGFVIDRELEIIGQGNAEDIVVVASGANVMRFQATMGRISNLSLRQTGGGHWFAVDIVYGRLILEGCDITSSSLACVAVHNAADPIIRSNRIHHGKHCGVRIYESGLGTIEDNEIFANALSGIEIRSGGNPTVRSNRIYDAKESGVYVHEGGLGTIVDNEIFANLLHGISVRNGGNPSVRGNLISRNGHEAVRIRESGGGIFEGNDLANNTRGAWNIASDSEKNVIRRDNIEN